MIDVTDIFIVLNPRYKMAYFNARWSTKDASKALRVVRLFVSATILI
jgi:hypothetical protein